MKSRLVLVADDHDIMRNLKAKFFAQAGYMPIEANDGLAAIGEFWLRGPGTFALLSLNIRMKWATGPLIWKIVRNQMPRMPILLSSADQHYYTAADINHADPFTRFVMQNESIIDALSQTVPQLISVPYSEK